MPHKHVSPAPHSREQAKLFFSLANQLNYNPMEVKRRAKLHFSAECFNALPSEQINQSIDRLLLKIEEQEGRTASRD
jgi:hypothetical protein